MNAQRESLRENILAAQVEASLQGHELATEREARREAEISAAKAEAKLEQFTESAVINVVHSQAVQDGGEDDRPFWKRWLGRE